MTDRKDLVRKYKETPRPMGVYRILNSANGKALVGSSRDIPGKLNRHRAQLRLKAHGNEELQRDWEDFGPDAFAFETLDLLEPPREPGYDPTQDLEVLEDLWLQKLQPFGDRGYNRKGRRF